MKTHTSQFKEEIKKFGRQIDSIITYQLGDETLTLGKEDLNSITPTFQSSILKSAMKQLDIDSNVDIPLGTKINYQFGVLVNDEYEYLNYGDYIVFSSEKQEDARSYKIVCYDVMLYAMTEYHKLQSATFPLTVRDYIKYLSNDIALEFINQNTRFANYNMIIPADPYEELGYTYRDIFDELSQVVGGTICINENNQVEVRYINDVYNEIIDVDGNNLIRIENALGTNIDKYYVYGNSEQEETPDPYNPQDINNIKGYKYNDDNIISVMIFNDNDGKYFSIDIGNNELSKINDIQDELDFTNGKLIKRTNKIVLDGTEDWKTIASGNLYYITFDGMKNVSNINNIGNLISTHYKTNSYKKLYDGTVDYGISNHTANRLCIRNKDITSINDFKDWLSNNNVVVYYEINEEQEIELQPTNIKLFDGVNNIVLQDSLQTKVEISYKTAEIIDEEYLKDINVNFGEKYGPINSIVLSRANADNVYIQDEESIEENGLCELKIVDNQIMNGNNRSDYLPELLNKLNGLEYYINDFSSTGICYLDLLDRYIIKIGDNNYSCVMFNDEVNITQGLEENIYTELPEDSETDYTKADKTDRKINQTTLIVDKQNQQIEAVVSQTSEQNEKIAKISATVDELNSKISDVANVTISGESSYGEVDLNNINQSEPILLKVFPIIENISYLYPNNNLYPSNSLYSKGRTIRFENIKTNEIFDYELPDDLLYYDGNTYDIFNLSYDLQSCIITKKCRYDENGDVIPLEEERIDEYQYPYIPLTDGDYKISILGYETGYIYATLMASNIYTTQFATKVELSSQIRQTNNKIELGLSEKLDGEEFTGANIILQINNDKSVASIDADKIKLEGYTTINDGFSVDLNGNVTMNDGTFNGTINGGIIEIKSKTTKQNPYIRIEDINSDSSWAVIETTMWSNGISVTNYADGGDAVIMTEVEGGYAKLDGNTCEAFDFIPVSLESLKTDFEKIDNGLDLIKDADIYSYYFKNDKNKKNKRIGLVIPDEGGEFNTPNEVIAENGKGIDLYAMVSVSWNAIKQQQKQIEELKKQINELKEMIDNG